YLRNSVSPFSRYYSRSLLLKEEQKLGLFRSGLKNKFTRHTAVCDRSEILYPRERNDLFFTQGGLHPDSISGQARNTTMQVWTVGERFGIGSEFRQTCCAANNFRDHDLDGVKAILVYCAHRLLSESTRILCTLEEQAPWKANARRLHQVAILASQAGSPRPHRQYAYVPII